ncbi:MmcQ/YjbR family DNA-binding protein [Marinomonas atlantica]|uniref:MmcQ/YjbR family DNA-binding protein n=1 Tax=Marinomonas atlantica TaxID=1806668 RepID=UPI00082F0304|nr:MmcQ/YjbR family DNA-binding protein [Marinomonas atlantica]MCO4785960.1 MmcQ/YjbR family DNA-binding protein [Marinomonas atlantica]
MSGQFNDVKAYIKAKPEAKEEYPFKPDVPVFKVYGKMFALLSEQQGTPVVNLKCDPEHAIELRSIFETVKPGYHMNKKHWNTVYLDDSLPIGEVMCMVDQSYELVVRGLTKKDRQSLELRYSSSDLYGRKSDS